MSNYNNYTLKLDLEFTNLIQPLEDREHKSLERKISFHAYSEPIYTWNGLIVDGVEAYQICHKRGVKFRIKRMYFLSREDAISWICTQQLKREDLTEANRKYVIGKKYDAVKAITARISSENSTTGKGGHTYRIEKKIPCRHISATQIASECNTSPASVYKYNEYSRALDNICEKTPQMVERIRSGKLRISHANIIELSRLPHYELKKLYDYMIEKGIEHLSYPDMKRELQWRKVVAPTPKEKIAEPKPVIKQMPKFDPDAELSSLSLTIPSWCSSIERVMNVTDFQRSSKEGKKRLKIQLSNLMTVIDKITKILEEA